MPYMIDKSALARMSNARVQARLVPVLEAGEAATCAIIDLEVLYSTRNASDHPAPAAGAGSPIVRGTDREIFQRAIEVRACGSPRTARVPRPPDHAAAGSTRRWSCCTTTRLIGRGGDGAGDGVGRADRVGLAVSGRNPRPSRFAVPAGITPAIASALWKLQH